MRRQLGGGGARACRLPGAASAPTRKVVKERVSRNIKLLSAFTQNFLFVFFFFLVTYLKDIPKEIQKSNIGKSPVIERVKTTLHVKLKNGNKLNAE